MFSSKSSSRYVVVQMFQFPLQCFLMFQASLSLIDTISMFSSKAHFFVLFQAIPQTINNVPQCPSEKRRNMSPLQCKLGPMQPVAFLGVLARKVLEGDARPENRDDHVFHCTPTLQEQREPCVRKVGWFEKPGFKI